MRPPASPSDGSSKVTAGSVVDGISDAMDRAGVAAGQAAQAVSTLRESMRRSPLTMSVLMLSIGYVIGTVTHTWPGTRRN